MRTKLFLLAFVSLGMAGPCLAQVKCDPAGTQLEMNTCARQDYDAEDARLNQVYKAYAARLDDEHRALLKAVQLDWIKFRDSACEFEAHDNEGGSIYGMVLLSCKTAYTRQRREQLEALLADDQAQ